MKSNSKKTKLVLSRETLRALDTDQLAAAAAGRYSVTDSFANECPITVSLPPKSLAIGDC